MKTIYWKLRLRLLSLWLMVTRPLVILPRKAIIGSRVYFGKERQIEIGEQFFCGYGCHFGAPTKIGKSVMFAPRVALVGGDHKIDNSSLTLMNTGRDEFRQIVICDGAWIGYGAVVLHGVTIGSGAVVASGSVVTKDVPPLAIFAGNPATLVRYRKGVI